MVVGEAGSGEASGGAREDLEVMVGEDGGEEADGGREP